MSPCRISCLSVSAARGGADVWIESDVDSKTDVDVSASAEAGADVCLESKRTSSSFFFPEHPLMPASLQRARSSARVFLEESMMDMCTLL